MANFMIDSQGLPSWGTAHSGLSPKAAFALEAAKRLRAGKLTIERLKQQIIDVANLSLERQGSYVRLHSLTDVQKTVSATAHMWFNEIKRVSSNEDALDQLIKQKGDGLTALYRHLGHSQAQREKGFAHPTPAAAFKRLKRVVVDLERSLESVSDKSTKDMILGAINAAHEQLVLAQKEALQVEFR